jgi:hypothetical protein
MTCEYAQPVQIVGSSTVPADPTGTKTFAYNPDGTIASITGTGGFRTLTFTYNGDGTIDTITVS